MDLLGSFMKPSPEKPTEEQDHQKAPSSSEKDHHKARSSSELLSDAKLVAEAAKSSFNRETGKQEVDKAKAAEAAENLLEAASRYGKLDDQKGMGQYVEKAENYLHQYHSSHSTTTTTNSSAQHTAGTAGGTTTQSTPSQSSDGGGGYGDYMKMAQGFLKK